MNYTITALIFLFSFSFSIAKDPSFLFSDNGFDLSNTICKANSLSDEVLWGSVEFVEEKILDVKPENVLLERTTSLSSEFKKKYLTVARERKTYNIQYKIRVLMFYDKEKGQWKKSIKNDALLVINTLVEEGWYWDGASMLLTRLERNNIDKAARIFFISHQDDGRIAFNYFSAPKEKNELVPINCKAEDFIRANQVNEVNTRHYDAKLYRP